MADDELRQDRFINEYRLITAGEFTFGDESGYGLKREFTIKKLVSNQIFTLESIQSHKLLGKCNDLALNSKDDFFDGLNPVESVTWEDCQDFLREINSLHHWYLKIKKMEVANRNRMGVRCKS